MHRCAEQGAIVLLIQTFLQQSPHHTSVVKAQG